jgi:hypothetical protein
MQIKGGVLSMALENKIELTKGILYMAIEDSNYCLTDNRVVCLSKMLDDLINEQQLLYNSDIEMAS